MRSFGARERIPSSKSRRLRFFFEGIACGSFPRWGRGFARFCTVRDGQVRTSASRARRSTAERRRVAHVRTCACDEAPPSSVWTSNAPLLGSNPTRAPPTRPPLSSPRPAKGGHLRSRGENPCWLNLCETDPTTTTNGVMNSSTTPCRRDDHERERLPRMVQTNKTGLKHGLLFKKGARLGRAACL